MSSFKDWVQLISADRMILLFNACILTKVLELKVCIFWHLFTFPVARFCLILKCLAAKEMTLPSPGFEPGTFSMWSQCATILPWLLHSNCAKSWEVIPIFVYIAGSQKLLEIKYPFFCFKYFTARIFAEWALLSDIFMKSMKMLIQVHPEIFWAYFL